MTTIQQMKARNAEITVPIYAVDADTETGEWLGEPVDTGETTTLAEWFTREDTDAEHYDTYEHFDASDRFDRIRSTYDIASGETRAIICRFV